MNMESGSESEPAKITHGIFIVPIISEPGI